MIASKKTTLSNGVRVITESYPEHAGVYVGFYLLTGTRDEARPQAGISHLLEHMVFKGTKKRSPYDIALALESVGGDINAYTTKEYTCYHTTSLAEHLPLSLDVLSDLVFRSTFPVKEFDRERHVVLQEISMSKEEYSEYIYDLFLERSLGKHATGFPILGSEESISKMKRKDLVEYAKERYVGKNLIVTVVGNINHDHVVDQLESYLARVKPGKKVKKRTRPKFKTIDEFIQAPSEQAHVLFGFPTSSYADKDRYDSYFLSTLLGGGMTSKLYQELREKRGMAYSVYSYLYTFFDFAYSFIYLATEVSKIDEVKTLIDKELRKLIDKGVTKKDVELYRTQMKGQILLSVDDVESRMTTLAHNEMIFGRQREVKEVISEIDKISKKSVEKYIGKTLNMKNISRMVMADMGESK